MSLIVDVATKLQAAGIGTINTDVFYGEIPDAPGNCLCIYNTGGYGRELVGGKVERPTFMVMVRNGVYATGEIKCNSVKDAVHAVNNETINSNRLLLIQQEGDIISLGRDAKKQWRWTLNFSCIYERA